MQHGAPLNGWVSDLNSVMSRLRLFTKTILCSYNDPQQNLGIFAMAASETYFRTTPRISFKLERMIITLISTMREIKVQLNPIKKAGITLLNCLQWLTEYFIIQIPFLTSFSTLMCIIIEATNLAAIMSREDAGVTTKPEDVAAQNQMHMIMII